MTSDTPRGERRWQRPKRPPRGIRATLALLAVVIAVLVLLLFAVTWLPVRHARDAYRDGHVAQSIDEAERWSGRLVWEQQFDQILAASYLTAGKPKLAAPHLEALRATRLWIPALAKADVARRLFTRGRYAEFLTYDEASREVRHDPGVVLDRAAAQIATGRLAAAEATIQTIDRGKVNASKLAAVEQSLAARKSGSIPIVLDRNGQTIAAYQLATHDLVAVDTRFAPLIEKEAGPLTIESQLAHIGTNDRIVTTLDPAVQEAALAALSGFRGSLVAIDPRTNEVLALASNRGAGPIANLALESQYEPGSVIKILTALNAISGGVDVKSMFPYDCKGDLLIDGRHFGDWLSQGHGILPTLDDALAESCNIAFADIGLRVGVDRLERFMRAAGFDAVSDLGVFSVPLGRIVPPIFNRYETAFLAIGLQHETITTLHLAMLASMVANRGTLTAPKLVRERLTLTGESVGGAGAQGSRQLVPREVGEEVVHAMTAVVTSARGTGRRAAVEGLTIAMKTGTAGDRPTSNLQSVILAFAPVEKPKIAFGLIAEDAGPAEFAGAKIAHDFLEATKTRK